MHLLMILWTSCHHILQMRYLKCLLLSKFHICFAVILSFQGTKFILSVGSFSNLIEILGENAYTKVFDGRDPSTGERLPAGYSEYNGEKVQSLADYFSAQLMKQAKNTTYIFQIYLSAKAI